MNSSYGEVTETSGSRWYREISWPQWRILIAAWGVWVLDAVDFLAITFVLSDIARAFDVSLQKASLLLLATYGVRWLGGLLFGSLSDRIGRKVPLLITLLWFTLGAVLTGASWSFFSLAFFRMFLGLGMAPGFSLGATMVAESWPEKHRAIGIGFLDTGWGVGAMGAALTYNFVYVRFGWRAMFFIGVIPAILLALFIIFFVPEVEVWKKQTHTLSLSLRDSPMVILFKRYPKRIAYLALLMFVLCFGSWPFQGLLPTFLKSLNFAPATISLITLTAAGGQIAGFVACGFIAERLGRRIAISLMLALGAVSVSLLVVGVHSLLVAEICSFLGGFFLVGSSGIWGTILTENLPREVRATGVGFLYNFGVIGGGVAPFVVLAAVRAVKTSMAVGIISFTLLAAALALVILRFVQETKGKSLHDIDAEIATPV